MRRISDEQPLRPRAINPAIPRDLETIVLKAIAREPAHRYPSGKELADDLGCFLEDQPIRARRLGGPATVAVVASQSGRGQPDRTGRGITRSGCRGGHGGLRANDSGQCPGHEKRWPAIATARRPKPSRPSPWRLWTTSSNSTLPNRVAGGAELPLDDAGGAAVRVPDPTGAVERGRRPVGTHVGVLRPPGPAERRRRRGCTARWPTQTAAWEISIAGWDT